MMRHRGPDDEGIWLDTDSGIGLAHARLAILDVSPAGRQPMESSSGRYVIVFNGEIYNHQTLRRELEQSSRAPTWRGHSDTETLLAGFEAWGVVATLKRAEGMFAIGLWDRRDRVLSLARDRIGEKPLYYGQQKGAFLFGSELRSLRAHPAFHAPIDRGAITLLLRHNYIPAPYSIYEGIHKLEPGCVATVTVGSRPPIIERFWDFREIVTRGAREPFQGSEREAIAELERELKRAISQQMVADVPLGAFLSGGVDSSLIVALMQELGSRPVKTFTIGFHNDEFNEAPFAEQVARHIGTEHTSLYVTPEEALSVVPRLPRLFSEPFADSSQIPTFLVSQLARSEVTVSLSGDAGDELFGGYNRYALADATWRRVAAIPRPGRRAVSSMLTALSPGRWNALVGPMQSWLPAGMAQAQVGDKIHKAAGVLSSRSQAELYTRLVSHWTSPADVVIGGYEPTTILTDVSRQPHADGFVEQMMALDTLSYLPDDILVKVDRAAMGVSLETRVPLLDHRVVELAWRLPLRYKLRGGVTKRPLREILYRRVPQRLIERPKRGFGIPLADWLRGPLREWAEDLLSVQRLSGDGYLNPAPIRQLWMEHLSETRNWQYHLWDILVFQEWLIEQRG
jgi:asparagine synthase (glutamine-hydrolysing)